MKGIKLSFIALIGATLFSCSSGSQESAPAAPVQETQEVEKKELAQTGIPVDSMTASIDAKRSMIEQEIGEPLVVSTENLREKVKQKWEAIHFYTIDDKLARVKTYPYASISNRTEEFYISDGALILVVIEDDGAGERQKPKDELDKMYYFNLGSLIAEKHLNDEPEYTIKNSDAEELLAEFNEYIAIYNENK